MQLSRYFLGLALLGTCLMAACSAEKPAIAGKPVAASAPVSVGTPAPSPQPAANPAPVVSAPPVVTSAPVKAPPPPFNGPLPNSVLAWDSELKSIDVHEGEDEGHLFFAFTNVSAEDVVILNVHPGCGCTTAQIPSLPWTIVPGTNSQIGVTINLHGKVGTIFKNLTVTTDKGIKTLNFRVNILPVMLPTLSDADRAKNMEISHADRQAVFHGDCVSCHVKQGEGKYGKRLYDADCGICHEGEHRATMVPDLRALKVPTNTEFWRTWIAHGKPGSLMPAFSTSDGGPLDDMQIATIAAYLNLEISSKSTVQ